MDLCSLKISAVSLYMSQCLFWGLPWFVLFLSYITLIVFVIYLSFFNTPTVPPSFHICNVLSRRSSPSHTWHTPPWLASFQVQLQGLSERKVFCQAEMNCLSLYSFYDFLDLLCQSLWGTLTTVGLWLCLQVWGAENKISKHISMPLVSLHYPLWRWSEFSTTFNIFSVLRRGKLQNPMLNRWEPSVDIKNFNFIFKNTFTLSTWDKCSSATSAGWSWSLSDLTITVSSVTSKWSQIYGNRATYSHSSSNSNSLLKAFIINLRNIITLHPYKE